MASITQPSLNLYQEGVAYEPRSHFRSKVPDDEVSEEHPEVLRMDVRRHIATVTAITSMLATASLALAPAANGNVEPTYDIADTSSAADAAIARAPADDPAGFQRRVDSTLATEAFEGLPTTASTGDRKTDAEAPAATVDETTALAGLMDMLSQQAITIEQDENGDTYWQLDDDAIEQGLQERTVSGSSMGSMGMPRCASAWAAALTWISANAGKCAIFGPKAAVVCGMAYGLSGKLIDFNRSC